MASNQISGRIPERVGQLIGLTGLNMKENFFEGTIPDSIGMLKNIVVLVLQENKLFGNIPVVIGNLTVLSELYLHTNKFEGSIPFTLRYCTKLQSIGVSDNNLSGNIPNQTFGYIEGLINLDLSNNSLTGSIPSDLGNLKHLSVLYLYANKLSGEIPNELNACLTLIELLLQKNFFNGSIPSFLGSSLRSLQILDLSNNNFSSTIPPELKDLTSLSILNLSFNHLCGEVPIGGIFNNITIISLIGKGSSGTVYKGSLLSFERLIAVKVFNLETQGATKSFMVECNVLGKIKHRNLVKILTCCSCVDLNGKDFKAIVFDFMPNGSLENLLHDNEGAKNHNLSLLQIVDITLDVAHALDYLHNDTEQVVVHCDVKPSNVLLDNDMVGHLGDFGLARLIHRAAEYSSKDEVNSFTVKGTVGYVPPEYGAGGLVSPQGDIYSYGILLLEMLTGKRPTNSIFYENLSLHNFCKMKIPNEILEIVDSRLLMPFSKDQTWVVENNINECLVMFAKIGVSCSEQSPTQRMSTKDVIKKLHEIKQKLY
ncbi:LRR receptor-like kinase [Trifolium medium]|uniref:non-specific serine/threonine protein kinase n=1 Tax=Trifolium medium TaxID=97028 RepID=A0A392M6H6_9FABA|nr:LRR receptor-like kinase [Trifolium medium]